MVSENMILIPKTNWNTNEYFNSNPDYNKGQY